MDQTNKPKIVITGFGVFRNYLTNPSWEAVKLLEFPDIDAEVIKLQIPVVYCAAEKEVERIWNQHNPSLVIHCGVSSLAKCITLEQRAVCNKERYCKPDVNNCLPICAKPDDDSIDLKFIETNIDLKSICNDVNDCFKQNSISLHAEISNRAGEYLCEYIYMCSLLKNRDHTLFIHVPQVCNRIDEKMISKALQVAILSAYNRTVLSN